MTTTTDGRSTRWDEHRVQRRKELVRATIEAIREHGAGVGMDEIAATAGTSKTVIYRHFTDRAGLYAAVVEHVDEHLRASLARALIRPPVPADLGPATGPDLSGDAASRRPALGRTVITAAIDTYLELVERDPELYRFLAAAPVPDADDSRGQPEAGGLPARLTTRMADILRSALDAVGAPTGVGPVWAAALVGMVWAAADDWMRPGSALHGLARVQLCSTLTDLAWRGVAEVAGPVS